MAQAQELINEIQKGLLQWYDFKEDRQALYVGDKSEPLAQMLFEKKLHVVCASLESVRGEDWQQEYDGYFDYIVCIEILEKQTEPEIFLKEMEASLAHKFAKKPEVLAGNMAALEAALREVRE